MVINTLTAPVRTILDRPELGSAQEPVATIPRVKAVVEYVAGRIAECIEGRYVALLLVGAAARGESTRSTDGGLLSDLDFLVVLPQRYGVTAALAERRCRERLRTLDTMLAPNILEKVSVGFASSLPRYWSVATPFMWELRDSGRVLYGSEGVKEWPAIRRASQIPQWEGLRLVSNRMCELLGAYGASCGLSVGYPDGQIIQNLRYACVKMGLACSEAALIDERQYAGSYCGRSIRHRQVAARFSAAQNELIAVAYHAKISGETYLPGRAAFDLVRDALGLAVSTLSGFGLHTPVDLAWRVKTEEPAAPGALTHIAHFLAQRSAGKVVPPRRAIAAVYAEAYNLASSLTQSPTAWDQGLACACHQLGELYKKTPQVVSVIESGGGV